MGCSGSKAVAAYRELVKHSCLLLNRRIALSRCKKLRIPLGHPSQIAPKSVTVAISHETMAPKRHTDSLNPHSAMEHLCRSFSYMALQALWTLLEKKEVYLGANLETARERSTIDSNNTVNTCMLWNWYDCAACSFPLRSTGANPSYQTGKRGPHSKL